MRVTWGWRGFIKRGPTLSRPQVTLTPEPPSVGPQIPPGSQWPSYPDLHRCGLAPASAQGLKPAWARGAKPSDFTRRAQWEAPPLCGCPRPGVAVSSRRGWSAGPGGTPALEPAPQALDPPALETAGSPGFWQRWGVGLCYSGPVAFATSLCPEWTTGSRHREGPFSRSPVPVAILCCPPPGVLERAPRGWAGPGGALRAGSCTEVMGAGCPAGPLWAMVFLPHASLWKLQVPTLPSVQAQLLRPGGGPAGLPPTHSHGLCPHPGCTSAASGPQLGRLWGGRLAPAAEGQTWGEAPRGCRGQGP